MEQLKTIAGFHAGAIKNTQSRVAGLGSYWSFPGKRREHPDSSP